MCTAYEIGKRTGNFPAWFRESSMEHLLGLDEIRIIRPTIPAPVILPDGSLEVMIWGFRRPVPGGKTKQLWRTIVNSREDKLQGRMWSKAFAERRCLIPAVGFYEWIDSPRGKIPLRFEDPDGHFLWIAGIWEEDQERGRCFSMITTDPNELIVAVHDRMPAVLSPDQLAPFMTGGLQEFGPSRNSILYSQAENFLKKRTKSASDQQDLF